jgi:monoamine oxidase
MEHYDVLIIGAGAAGLMAALELALTGKKTAVIEAKDDIGGRARSFSKLHFQTIVEAGAEFVHGNLELTQLLLKKAGISYHQVRGDMWMKADGKWEEQKGFIEDFSAVNTKLKSLEHDISVRQFIDQRLAEPKFEEARFTLENYVEGYYAADINRASSFSLREDLNKSDEEQYRIEGGYQQLFRYLFNQCVEKQVQFYFSHPVNEINWQKDNVSVTTQQNTFTGSKLLVTVPVGVLQSKSIRFSPALQEKEKAVASLGYGGVVKTILQFREAFWKDRNLTAGNDLQKLGFIFSDAKIPTWWTRYPEDTAILTGWSAGRHAGEVKDLSEQDVVQTALQSLSHIFELEEAFFQNNLLAWHIANWVNDPYSCGGYSYEVVNGKKMKEIMLQPVENTIWFTGEGLFDGAEIGTVNAALFMGRNSAHGIIASFKS